MFISVPHVGGELHALGFLLAELKLSMGGRVVGGHWQEIGETIAIRIW